MKPIQYKITILFILLLLCCSCKRNHSKPEGFPHLYPCDVYVELDHKPASDVEVLFRATNPSTKWAIGGTTDAQGKFKVLTHGVHIGIPEGEYKVVFYKREEEKSKYTPPPENSKEYEKWLELSSKENLAVYTLIDPKFEKKETTPFSVIVEKNSKELRFDLGKSIRKRVN